MPYPEFHYHWKWDLKSTPEALWPFLADTNRTNHDSATPSIQNLTARDALTNSRRRLRLFRLGVAVEWEEEPFEWVRPMHYGVVRRYTSGPVAVMRILADLTPSAGGGTRVEYNVWATPRTPFGLLAIPVQIGVFSARGFDKAVRQYDRLASIKALPLELPTHVTFAPGGRERLTTLRERLGAQSHRPDLADRLAQVIEHGDDLALVRLRPYVLADYWGAPRREVLELCLWATRLGLLDFQWDLLCPSCRGAKQSVPTLGNVEQPVHCDNCHIDFRANFERSVELTFRPNGAIRQIEFVEYCVGGPQVTPHIRAQQLLAPGEERRLTVPLEEGRYHVRAPLLSGNLSLLANAQGAPETEVRAAPSGWANDEPQVNTRPTLRLVNATDSEQLIILERTEWSDTATTAADVTTLQLFRDLFANEALRPGEQISVGSLTVVFTDLRGSTRMYRQIGDAPAFGRVMSHFDLLRQVITEHEGALVKTIGDAVMAVFRRPAAAMRAMLDAQKRLAAQMQNGEPLELKVGIHFGPCIAVTLNDRLDYFGSTVNLASRLEGLSTGQDIIISASIASDPEVVALLADPAAGLAGEKMQSMLKGFDEEQFELWRVMRQASSQ